MNEQRLIDANVPIEKIEKRLEFLRKEFGGCYNAATIGLDEAWVFLETTPTVTLDDIRPKGKWIDAYPKIEPSPMFAYGICSECGFEQSISNKLNFCPNCGADMRGEG